MFFAFCVLSKIVKNVGFCRYIVLYFRNSWMLALWFVLVLWSILWSCFSLFSTNRLKIKQNFVEIWLKRLFPLAVLCAIFSIPLSQKASSSVDSDTAIFDRSFDLFWDGVRQIEVINQAKLCRFFLTIQNRSLGHEKL